MANEEQDFMSALGDMVDAAQGTELGSGGGGCPLPAKAEFHLEVVGHEATADSNEYGPFVKAKVAFKCIEPGEFEDTEWNQVYFINKTKEGKLSFGGQSYVQLANVLAGAEIEGNNPQEAAAVISNSVGAVVRVKTWADKKGYIKLDPLSLESGTDNGFDEGGVVEPPAPARQSTLIPKAKKRK